MSEPTTEAGRALLATDYGSDELAVARHLGSRNWTTEDIILAIEAEARAEGVDACIALVEQSLATVRGEDDGVSSVIKASISAREHVLSMLTGHRGLIVLGKAEQ